MCAHLHLPTPNQQSIHFSPFTRPVFPIQTYRYPFLELLSLCNPCFAIEGPKPHTCHYMPPLWPVTHHSPLLSPSLLAREPNSAPSVIHHLPVGGQSPTCHHCQTLPAGGWSPVPSLLPSSLNPAAGGWSPAPCHCHCHVAKLGCHTHAAHRGLKPYTITCCHHTLCHHTQHCCCHCHCHHITQETYKA